MDPHFTHSPESLPDGTFQPPPSAQDPPFAHIADSDLSLTQPNAEALITSSPADLNGGSEAGQVTAPELFPELGAPPEPAEGFVAIVKWRGKVLQRRGSTFLARLEPIVGDSTIKMAEIFTEDVPEEDLQLLNVGATFYWSIGYLKKRKGTRLKASIIRFRRFPEWSDRELREAREFALQLKLNLHGGHEDSASAAKST